MELQTVEAPAPTEATVQAAFDYAQIDEGIRDEVKQAARSIRQLEQGVITGILAIGKRLIEVKGMLEHGQFEAWVEAEFGMKPRSAQNMMNLARECNDPQKRKTLTLFSPSVAYLLAAPSMPEEARVEVEERAAAGEKITVATVNEVKAKHSPPPIVYSSATVLGNMIWEWAHNHARETQRQPIEELEFVTEGSTTRAERRRAQMCRWLVEHGVVWREGDLLPALQRLLASQRQAQRQAPAREVYDPPTAKPEPAKTEDAIVHDLLYARIDSESFGLALRIASIAQLEKALKIIPPVSERDRFRKVGDRYELLLVAQDAASAAAGSEAPKLVIPRTIAGATTPAAVDAVIEAAAQAERQCVGFGEFDGRCVNKTTEGRFWCDRCDDLRVAHIERQLLELAGHDPDEAAAIATVEAEREEEEAERLAAGDGKAVIEQPEVQPPAKKGKLRKFAVELEREQPQSAAPSYLPASERIEIDDPDLRAAGFHLVRSKYGPDGWLWRSWWSSGDDANCGPQRGTMELAIADARHGLAKLRPLSLVTPAPTPPAPSGILTPEWIALTLTVPRHNVDNADFATALKAATADQIRTAVASLSTEDKGHAERLAAYLERLAELEPAPALPAPKITAMFVDTGKGRRAPTQPELDTINAWPEPVATVTLTIELDLLQALHTDLMTDYPRRQLSPGQRHTLAGIIYNALKGGVGVADV